MIATEISTDLTTQNMDGDVLCKCDVPPVSKPINWIQWKDMMDEAKILLHPKNNLSEEEIERKATNFVAAYLTRESQTVKEIGFSSCLVKTDTEKREMSTKNSKSKRSFYEDNSGTIVAAIYSYDSSDANSDTHVEIVDTLNRNGIVITKAYRDNLPYHQCYKPSATTFYKTFPEKKEYVL